MSKKRRLVFLPLFLSPVLTVWSWPWQPHFCKSMQHFVLGLPLHICSQPTQAVVGAPCIPFPFPSQLNQTSQYIAHTEEQANDNSTMGCWRKRKARRTLLYRTTGKTAAKGMGDHHITVVQNNATEMRWNVTHKWDIADVLPQGHKQNYNYR